MQFPKVGLTGLPGHALRALQSPNLWGDQAEMKRRGIVQGAMWTPGRGALQAPLVLRQILGRRTPWTNPRLQEIASRPSPRAQQLARQLAERQRFGPRG